LINFRINYRSKEYFIKQFLF